MNKWQYFSLGVMFIFSSFLLFVCVGGGHISIGKLVLTEGWKKYVLSGVLIGAIVYSILQTI